MKHIFVLLIMILNSAIGFGQFAEFSFLGSATHQFGKVNEGVSLKHYYVFVNSGDTPLIIDEAKVTCSCTKVEFPRYPILPQQKDSILVTFDTKQKYYQQDRIIKLKSNTKKQEKLRFKVYVIPIGN